MKRGVQESRQEYVWIRNCRNEGLDELERYAFTRRLGNLT